MRSMVYHRTLLQRQVGDPGIFSSIGKALKGVAGVAANLLPGPVGAVARTVIGASGGGGSARPPMMTMMAPQAGPGGVVPVPGFGGALQRMLPGGASGYTTGACITKDGRPRRIKANGQCWKRPSMNAGNMKAAARAIRRITAARRMLKALERSLPKVKATGGKRRGCGCK